MKIQFPLEITIENEISTHEAMKDIELYFKLKNSMKNPDGSLVLVGSSRILKFEILDGMSEEE